MIGVYLQRGILIMALISVPCIFANYHVDTILIWLGQQPGNIYDAYRAREWYQMSFWVLYRGGTIISNILSLDCIGFAFSNLIRTDWSLHASTGTHLRYRSFDDT